MAPPDYLQVQPVPLIQGTVRQSKCKNIPESQDGLGIHCLMRELPELRTINLTIRESLLAFSKPVRRQHYGPFHLV